MIGIYKIENTINHRVYIGQSVDISKRISVHKWKLENNEHENEHLQRAYNKYGADAFKFSIVEVCCPLLLNSKETKWCRYYKPNVYNLGHTGCVNTVSEETTKKRVRSLKKTYETDLTLRERKRVAMLGKKHSEESKRKVSISNKKFYKEHPEKVAEMIARNKKLVRSEEMKKRISETLKRKFATGELKAHWTKEQIKRRVATKRAKGNISHKHTEETKKRISASMKEYRRRQKWDI